MEIPIFYIHVEPYIVGKLGYIPQFSARYWVAAKMKIKFGPPKFRLYLDRI
jgi:hypothetical protein